MIENLTNKLIEESRKNYTETWNLNRTGPKKHPRNALFLNFGGRWLLDVISLEIFTTLFLIQLNKTTILHFTPQDNSQIAKVLKKFFINPKEEARSLLITTQCKCWGNEMKIKNWKKVYSYKLSDLHYEVQRDF